MAKNLSSKNLTMEELLASSDKVISLRRGQVIEGEIVAITNSELILDLGAKSEGVLNKKEFSLSQLDNLKIGSKLKAFVIFSENENGQVVLSLHQAQPKGNKKGGRNWSRFKNAQLQKSKLSGTVSEINKGGLIVESEGIRGFLPNSQTGFEVTGIGQAVNFLVSEVDEGANKLIFSQKGLTEDSVKAGLKNFKRGDKFLGKVVSVLPFGIVLEKEKVRGLVLISEVSWEKTEDLSAFSKDQEIAALVLGVDEDLGRLNLSIKQLSEDPFSKLVDKYPPDQLVKGEVVEVSNAGVAVRLEGPSGGLGTSKIEGFLPSSKMDPDTKYEVGLGMSFLADGVDMQRRRVNLAPFVTSTAGLIYK